MTDADRKKAQAERQRRAALRSSVIQELRQQYSDAPEEIREKRDFQTERDSREELHRRVLGVWGSRPSLLQMSLCNLLCRKNYEESMMVRLSLPKRAKTGRKRGLMSMSTQLSGITHFGDITALTGGEVSCTHTHTRSTPAVPSLPPGSILHTAPSSSARFCCRTESLDPRKRRKS